MNSSGIIRRVDELGRIVIPVEVRRLMNIRVGENLEFLVNNGLITLKKKSYLENNTSSISPLIDVLHSTIKCSYFFTDREHILFSSNKELEHKILTSSLNSLLNNYEEYNIVDSIKEYDISSRIYLFPYYIETSISGFIGLYNVDNINEYIIAMRFICKYIQELFTLSWK